MYRQSIKNIKAVILPLDGTILDLNRLRYNYYNHLCKNKNVTFSKQQFYNHISNMYDMYKGLPLSQDIDIGPLNAKIERELLQYLKYKGIQTKEGIRELIEYLHQKDIPIAVISTHRTKDAVEYLQMTQLYHKVQFIIGSDTSSLPLPSSQILKTVVDYFQIKNEEALVISSFDSLNQAASQLHMNIIYCEDLMSANEDVILSSYKTATNIFEVLNILLFDQYEDVDMYAPILGMNEHMSKNELDVAYQNAKNSYHDDPQLVQLIEKTYSHHLLQLNEKPIIKPEIQLPKEEPIQPLKKRFSFDDEDETIIKESQPIQEDVEEDFSPVEENTDSTYSHIRTLDHNEEKELADLLQKIGKKEVTFPIEEEVTPIIENQNEEPYEEDKEKSYSIVSLITNIFYVFAISFFILFIGILFSVAFIHQLRSNEGFFGMIYQGFQLYYGFIEFLFKGFFNGLHSFINFVPSYEGYFNQLSFLSRDGIQLFHIFLFNSIIIAVIKGIYALVKGDSYDDDQEN